MCGIYCEFCSAGHSEVERSLLLSAKKTQDLLTNRGPNSANSISLAEPNISFFATLLWQQGEVPKPQPLQSNKFLLLLNGDCFMNRENYEISDTEWLLNLLNDCDSEPEILSLFKTLIGPLSLICLDKTTQKLYFFRDSLGRNSLLIGKNGTTIILSSVMEKPNDGSSAIELPALGVYVYDFSPNSALALHPWQDISNHEIYHQQIEALQTFLNIEVVIFKNLEPDWLKPTTIAKPDYNFFEVCHGVSQADSSSDLFDHITKNPKIAETIDTTIALLTNSIRDRIQNTPKLCKACVTSKAVTACKHARIGLLFSGGLDCSLLARITDQLLDKAVPIDLMNVAFEKVCRQPKKIDCEKGIVNWNVPDRITARESLAELQRLSPDREWRLVEINISREELNDRLSNHISHLVYPLETVLDESIGAALWFAARSKGCVEGVAYQSVCRVMLIGSGADELFGGYTRHRNAYTRNNKIGDEPNLRVLEEELDLDWVRLPTRNLARDDRIISDHGCTARSPFVEETFTNFIRNLRSDQKCCHALEAGIGDKLLLRLCAHRLGLGTVCTFKKRALQFGTRIADRKQNAKDRSVAL